MCVCVYCKRVAAAQKEERDLRAALEKRTEKRADFIGRIIGARTYGWRYRFGSYCPINGAVISATGLRATKVKEGKKLGVLRPKSFELIPNCLYEETFHAGEATHSVKSPRGIASQTLHVRSLNGHLLFAKHHCRLY